MAFFTKTEARSIAANFRRTRTAQSVLNEAMEQYKEHDEFDVFLSHSINDSDLVLGVMLILEKQGLRVYVDWIIDQQLNRDSVNKHTAAILRKRMKQSKSMMYIATDNSPKSKWMPWELGFFDGYKPGQVAILPLLDDENEKFQGQEYLGLYPLVTKYINNNTINYFIEEYNERWSHLSEFARGNTSWKIYPEKR